MEIAIKHSYKHKEIKHLLTKCPVCDQSDYVEVSSCINNSAVRNGKETLTCQRCKFDVSFNFKLDDNNEIVDAYELDYLKIGQLEFRNTEDKLTLYANNTFLKELPSEAIDIHKYAKVLMMS